MKHNWESLLDDWIGEDCWENWAWENCSGPREIWVISPTGIVSMSRDCVTALSMLNSCVPTILNEFENGTLFENMIWCLII